MCYRVSCVHVTLLAVFCLALVLVYQVQTDISVLLFCFVSDDGISIPSDYTSYLAPLQSARLYSEFRVNKDKEKHPEVSPPSLCVSG